MTLPTGLPTGAIRFDSNPVANVIINGQPIGKTPIDVTDVAPGRYLYILTVEENPEYSIKNEVNVYPTKVTHIEMDFTTSVRNEEYFDIEERLPKVSEQPHEEPPKKPPEEPEQPPEEPSEEPGQPPEQPLEDPVLNELQKIGDLLNTIKSNTTPVDKESWYDNETSIQQSVDTQPVDPSSGLYQLEKIHDVIGHKSEKVNVYNDGPGILFIVSSNDGKNFSSETVLYEGESKAFNNIYTLGLRSPTKGLTYRATERDLVSLSGQTFSGSRFKDRRDRKGTIIFQDDIDSPVIKYEVFQAVAPSTITRSTNTAFSGDFSIKMVNATANTEVITRYNHPDSHFGRVGIQINFAIPTSASFFTFSTRIHRATNGTSSRGEVFIDTNRNLGFINGANVYTTLFKNVSISFATTTWNTIKVVFDYGKGFYDKVTVNGILYDFSNIPLETGTPIIQDNTLSVFFHSISTLGVPTTMYLDNYILTEDEPL